MSKQCQDNYFTQFSLLPAMQAYHEELRNASRWMRTSVKSLEVAPLDRNAPLFSDRSGFDAAVSEDAITDTAANLGLAVKVDGRYFPLRDTACRSLLDRAKISGTALPKLSREKLASVLNSCLILHKADALLLIRDEKVSAAHSGDAKDYSVLEIDQLMETEIFIPAEDPVRLHSAICERIDYKELYAAYSEEGRKEYSPRILYRSGTAGEYGLQCRRG